MRLTREQQAAVTARSSVAVTAGAGTGKTHLLVERYLFHLREQGMSPLDVVAVTFTNRAASELRARIRQALATRMSANEEWLAEIEAAPIGTIHGLCARICRDHPDAAGAPPSFEIIDDREGQLARLDWFNAALDRLPLRIYDEIPFSRLRGVLASLLADPVMAERALGVGMDETPLARWRELGELGKARVREELQGDTRWQAGLATLAAWTGPEEDTREIRRRTALELALRFMETSEASPDSLSGLANLDLRGGSEKKWVAGGFVEVKQALESLRDLARKALKRVRHFELTAADQELERRLPILREAFTLVRHELEQARRAAGQLDYSDLEVMARRALDSAVVREHYQRRWKAWLIDEFQDVNPIQAELLQLLTSGGCLTIVGDENQSIYGFRRATVSIYHRFREEIVAGGGERVSLGIGFRAHQELTSRINRIFETVFATGMTVREADRRMAPGLPPHLHHIQLLTVGKEAGGNKAHRQWVEARAVAARLRRLLDEGCPIHDRLTGELRPVEPADIAVLARTWRPLEIFGAALDGVGIASANMGGGDLLGTREALDLIALLRFLANPDDDVALIALLRSPFFAISDRVLQAASGVEKPGSWWRHLDRMEDGELAAAARLLRQLLAQRQNAAPGRLIQMADRLTGYSAVIANLPNAARRLADWQAMREWIMVAERRHGDDLFNLWRRLKLLLENGITINRPALEAGAAVSLMTIHAAKGLEWPIVVIPDLSGGVGYVSQPVLFDPELGVALKPAQDDEDGGEASQPVLYTWLEEEQARREAAERRRLLYVGLTRARDAIILSATERTGGLLDELRRGLDAAEIAEETILPSGGTSGSVGQLGGQGASGA
jgi:ATP-dependent helicase/nuclease subunit A